jgi:hypothetical protein
MHYLGLCTFVVSERKLAKSSSCFSQEKIKSGVYRLLKYAIQTPEVHYTDSWSPLYRLLKSSIQTPEVLYTDSWSPLYRLMKSSIQTPEVHYTDSYLGLCTFVVSERKLAKSSSCFSQEKIKSGVCIEDFRSLHSVLQESV